MSLSVCTLARGRDTHLKRLVEGLARQTIAPDELVIARMQEAPYEGLSADFPIRQIAVCGEPAPLAAARNRAAQEATGERLVFLDVDCLPGPSLLAGYIDAFARDPAGCMMGEVRYLAETDAPPTGRADDFEALFARAAVHPARRFGTAGDLVRLDDGGAFWSLSFGLAKATFARIGGFDEAFTGYGGEDTDFGVRLVAAQAPLYFVPGAAAVHQWHPVQKPPLDQLGAIVRNANLFLQKHGRPCMEYWLDQFEAAGYVARAAPVAPYTIVRHPSAAERTRAWCDGSVRFS